MLSEAGVPTREILRAATEVPARALGRTDLGFVRPGCHADLIVVGGNPLEDIGVLADIVQVFVGGRAFGEGRHVPLAASRTGARGTPA